MHPRLFLGAALLCGATTLLSAQTSYFSAALDGAQEVPANASTARGWAIVKLVQPANTVTVLVESTMAAATAAHIHIGASGVNGAVILPLAGGPGRWTGAGALSAANAAALASGGCYVNIHSAAFPGGEIRGQVVAAASTRFFGALNGANEVPPNASTARGTAVAFLHEPDNVLVYDVSSSGLVNVTAAHVHDGVAGANGPVLFPLVGSAGNYCGVSRRLSAAELTKLRSGALYVNIHTAAFPGGEIRSQLDATPVDYRASLDGLQEVPPTPSAALGRATLTIRPDGTVAYLVNVTGLAPTQAHVHRGAPGVNGGVVFALAGGPGVYSGISPVLTTAQLADLRGGLMYVNVHTAAFPGGEIRGQILPATLPTTFGGPCGGTTDEAGAEGFPQPGSAVAVRLFGSRPASSSLLILGTSRDAFAALPLPLDLALIGMPRCFLLCDDLGLGLTAPTDGNGCAAMKLGLPFLPVLTGLDLCAQWFTLAPGTNPLGLRASNGLTMRVQ
ncbi:MAG: CHRD domain-containing protein [Planctomycetes bacterium]|nr:CHRD domain-containing protein [Planctomycetota bacterium]